MQMQQFIPQGAVNRVSFNNITLLTYCI